MNFYLLIEPFGDLYRCLIRIPIWIVYLSSLNRDSELFNYKFSILAVLLFIVYIPIKCHNLYFYCVDINDFVKSRVIVSQLILIMLVIIFVCLQKFYEPAINSDYEIDDNYPICLDRFDNPVKLRCSNRVIYCRLIYG